jgi:hypothetical protein
MSREAMQKAFQIIGMLKPDNFVHRQLQGEAWDALRQALENPEPQVCCGDYEKCWKACTPRGRWLAEQELAKPTLPMSPEHLPQYIATNNIKPTLKGGGGAGGELAKPERKWLGLSDAELMKEFGYTDVLLRDTAYRVDQLLEWKNT